MHKLPEPDSKDKKRSLELTKLIQQKIHNQGGGICFSDYMQLLLYTPELGYYNSPAIGFGKSGDFITAPELSELFPRVVARQIAPTLEKIKNPVILEFGAGSGKMAAGIIKELPGLGINISSYQILETSKHLQTLQHETISNHAGEFINKIKWISKLPNKISGVMLANEAMDAMPVNRFIIDKNKTYELMVGPDFKLIKGPEIKLEMPFMLSEYPQGYISEYSNVIPAWVKSIKRSLNQGLILLIDYGYENLEYYHPARTSGSLKCFYKHLAHEDPFWCPGLCDISAHVNFTEIAKVADVCGFLYQSEFLIYGGITKLFEASNDLVKRARISKEIQTLTSPEQMGETIKVMALCKNISAPDFML